jgi:hypothetical protein
MPIPIYSTSRHTGWQLVFGLRTDQYSLGYETQSVIGCLDAPTSMPGGALRLDPKYQRAICVSETPILRFGD